MAAALSSLTVVVVARDYPLDAEALRALCDQSAVHFTDVEVVIICNGASAETALKIREIVDWLPDSTGVFLREEVHDDTARLLGIDYAVSDYVMFATPTLAEANSIPDVVAALRAGGELVLGTGAGGVVVQRSLISRLSFATFRAVYRLLSGKVYEAESVKFRVFSRAAALFIATSSEGEVLVRAREIGHGFPGATVPIGASPAIPAHGAAARLGVGKALRLLLTGSALPLRMASYLGVATGVLSVLYAGYAVTTYLSKADVAPGWTTLSLQSAGVAFLLSVQFLFLSEYLVQLLSSSPAAGRRHLVAREVRSSVSRRSGRLNVVDEQGRFHLGAPPQYLGSDA